MNSSRNDLLLRLYESPKTVFSIAGISLMNGLEESTDAKMKSFVKTKLRKETIQMLQFFKAFPTFVKS